MIDFVNHCAECGRYVSSSAPGVAWWADGEFGEDRKYACAPCVARPSFQLIAGNGSREPRWCGIIQHPARIMRAPT